MIYSGNVPHGRDIPNLCRHEPVVMANGAKIPVLSRKNRFVTGSCRKDGSFLVMTEWNPDNPSPRRRRHGPTGEGASRRPYAEAHAQVVPTVLPAFQGSL